MLSGNPITELDDLKDISTLSQLRELTLDCGLFQSCTVTEICNYREYVLSSVASPYFEQLDQLFLSEDEKNDEF